MITLYSTKCPKCLILEKKLKEKNIEYQEVNDVDIMMAKDFMEVPKLEVDGKVMNYNEAIKWIMEDK